MIKRRSSALVVVPLLALVLDVVPASSQVAVSMAASFAEQHPDGETLVSWGAAVAVWGRLAPALHLRIEVEAGVYSKQGGGTSCSWSCGRHGFSRMIVVSPTVVVGAPEGRWTPFATVGAAGLYGYGNQTWSQRKVLAPDVGVGVSLSPAWYLEFRQQWKRDWDGGSFTLRSLRIGRRWARAGG